MESTIYVHGQYETCFDMQLLHYIPIKSSANSRFLYPVETTIVAVGSLAGGAILEYALR